MPPIEASHSGNPGSPKPFCGDSSGSVLSPLYATLSALGSNASGSVVVAFSAMPMSLMLVVPLVGAGNIFASNNAPPGLCAPMTIQSMASTFAF